MPLRAKQHDISPHFVRMAYAEHGKRCNSDGARATSRRARRGIWHQRNRSRLCAASAALAQTRRAALCRAHSRMVTRRKPALR